MRLHTLRMSAVGPFAGTHVIDFDRLSAGGLFLFEGPTGVGKSTILDALTFVLYGGLASESGDPARMRSDFADPGDRPEVQLEFSVRGGRARITRSPEFTRPKKRGTGLTREKASVHLERFTDGAWESRSHAKDEVGEMVGELLGLNREQFRQVVLLPQGEFATFLRAGDDERREVLGRLFGTQFFQRIAHGLQARAQEASRTLQAVDSELRARVAAAAEAAGLSPGENAELSGAPLADRVDGVVALEEQLARQDRAAGQVRVEAELAAGEARAALATAESVVARLDQRAQIESALAEAQIQRPEQEHRAIAVARARRAMSLRPLLELVDRAQEAVTIGRSGVIEASLPNRADPKHLAGCAWQELATGASTARTGAGELAHLVIVEDQLAADRALIVAHRSTELAVRRELRRAEDRAGQIPSQLTAAREELAEAQQSAAGVPAAAALLQALAAPAQAAGGLDALRLTVDELKAARRAARRAFDEANDHHAMVMDQRLADVRGELAARLVVGGPCLVCGSEAHPAPAKPADAGVSVEQVRDAARARDDARLALDEAQVALVRSEADLENDIRMAGELDAAAWQERIDGLRAEVAAGQAAQEASRRLESRVAGLAEEHDDLGAQLRALTEQIAAEQAELAHLEGELAVREELVETAREHYGSVRDRATALVASAVRSEGLAAAVHDLSRCLEQEAAATAQAGAQVQQAGFADLDDARSAMLSPDELDQLDREVSDWEAAVAAAQASLASPELQQVADVDPASAPAAVAAAESAFARADQWARTAQEEATVASRQRARFAERLDEVQECAARRVGLAASNQQLVTLDQYARGMAGSPRMSLVTFVLRFWFEQVVAAANLRLESMSAGKYELLRVDDAARKDARVGLGLSILDRHTGRERSPGTLSGGESFYTSLALALGLADVVVAQAGGAQLDTLFIDEGFGSLDPDTLDDVMGVIDDLRGNGRVVGIVSHVPELKERIAERLSVRRVRPDGPSMVDVRA